MHLNVRLGYSCGQTLAAQLSCDIDHNTINNYNQNYGNRFPAVVWSSKSVNPLA